MDDHGLTIEVSQGSGHVLVTVAGEVDIATAPQLRERLAAPAAGGRPLIVDLDRVTFIDAAGLGALVGAASRAAACGGSLYAVCARHQVRRLFAITGLDRQIPLARTVREACQNLATARDTSLSGHRQPAPRQGGHRMLSRAVQASSRSRTPGAQASGLSCTSRQPLRCTLSVS